MDTTADACDDFFQLPTAAGSRTLLYPPSQARWGSFNILAESNRDIEHDILEKAAKQTNATGDIKLIGDFYCVVHGRGRDRKGRRSPARRRF